MTCWWPRRHTSCLSWECKCLYLEKINFDRTPTRHRNWYSCMLAHVSYLAFCETTPTKHNHLDLSEGINAKQPTISHTLSLLHSHMQQQQQRLQQSWAHLLELFSASPFSLCCDFVNCFRQGFDILWADSSHGNTPITGHVDAVILRQLVHLQNNTFC